MAIKVGQIRKNNSTSYITPINHTLTYAFPSQGVNTTFNDFAILGSFKKNSTYYIRVQINRIDINTPMGENTNASDNDPHNLNLDVKLYQDATDNTSPYQSIGETLLIEPYYNESGSSSLEKEAAFMGWCEDHLEINPLMDENATEYWNVIYSDFNARYSSGDNNSSGLGTSPVKTIELIFTPYLDIGANDIAALVFQLRRVSYDYTVTPRVVTIDETEGNRDVAEVGSILPYVADKIGIQTRPGSLVVINQEPMRVGKSGVLEINNGIKVTSVGMVAPQNEINDFILDYIYTE